MTTCQQSTKLVLQPMIGCRRIETQLIAEFKIKIEVCIAVIDNLVHGESLHGRFARMQLLRICRLNHRSHNLALGLLIRVAVALTFSPVFLAAPALAAEFGIGYGAVDQGDDRLEPAASVHAGLGNYVVNLYYYGREFGPIRQDTYLIGVAHMWPIFGGSGLSAHFGVSLMDERIRIKYIDSLYTANNNAENNFNVGINFGVAWTFLPKGIAPLWAQVAWDSHIYAAGLEGGILLSSGRKQVISLAVGVEFK